MSSKRKSWMRVVAFTIMLTLVLMTGATGLVVAEEGGFEGPPLEENGIIQSSGSEDPSGDDGSGKMDEGLPEGEGQTRTMSFFKPEKPPKLEIKLEKWVNPDKVFFQDDMVTFFFKVTNKSERSLRNVVLVDEDLGLVITIGELSKERWHGSVYTTEVAVKLDPDKWDGNKYINEASVSGTARVADNDIIVSDSAWAKVELKPIIGFAKEADRETVFFKDSTVTYTFTVTNMSNKPIADVMIIDPAIGLEIDAGSLGIHGKGKTFTTKVAVDLSENLWDGNSFTNTATVQGTVPWGEGTRSVSADASYTVKYQAPLTLEKTVDKSTVNFKDEKVTYTFKVKNNLWWDLKNVKVYDETIDAILDFGKVRKGQWETRTFAFDLTNAEWDGDQFINTARVEAPFMRGDTPVTLSAVDTAAVTYVPPMTLEKSVDPGTVYSQDGIVNYTFKVWNNLSDNTIKNVVLTDTLLDLTVNAGDIKAKGKWNKGYYTTTVAIDLSLIPEDSWDGNQLINEATAMGCYEKIKWAPRGNEGDFQTMKHWSPPTECITLTAVDTATLIYDPTTLTIKKDVPNVTDSAAAFDVLISWEEEWVYDEDSGDNEIPQYRTMVMNTTTKSIQGVISELEPFVMDAVPGVLYTVAETTKAGYTTSETSFQITLEPGEDGVITFVNTKDVIEEESSGGGGTNQGGSSGGGGDTDTNTIATVPDGQVPLAQDPVTVETLADLPIPLADVPQTGNNALLNLWWILLALSGFGILVVVNRKPEKI